MAGVGISTQFDSGAIEVVACEQAGNIHLRVPSDGAAPFRQWFHFGLSGVRGERVCWRFDNLASTAYPGGWEGYAVRASVDRINWFCVPTRVENGELVVEHDVATDQIWYAYFEPYNWERHLALLGRAQAGGARVTTLGQTLDGRPLDLITIGRDGGVPVWLTARQHPGETMAEYFAEGLIDALLDPSDAMARAVLDVAQFHIVPNMNPDGSVRGHLRTNAAGANLNREWQTPTMARSPEVALVRAAMEARGVALFLDAHGDETIPHNFVAGCEDNPSYSDKQRQLQQVFEASWLAASPDFQTEYGYGESQFGPETMTLATNWVGDRFDCLALTIEMPFKDTDSHPLAATGWNGERSRQFGRSVLQPVRAVLALALA
ncbi:M14 family metallopeptidase [Chitinibacteraceae bacterium HSL-7]